MTVMVGLNWSAKFVTESFVLVVALVSCFVLVMSRIEFVADMLSWKCGLSQ